MDHHLCCVHSRREVPRGVDGTPGIESEADVNGGEAETNERRHEAGRYLHILLVRHGEDDHQEDGGAQGLVRRWPGCKIAKFDPFLSLDCARVEGVGVHSKERRGSNFAA